MTPTTNGYSQGILSYMGVIEAKIEQYCPWHDSTWSNTAEASEPLHTQLSGSLVNPKPQLRHPRCTQNRIAVEPVLALEYG